MEKSTMNDLMNEFDPDDRETAWRGEDESWRDALGGLFKELALASTDSLTRRLRRKELEIGEADENDGNAVSTPPAQSNNYLEREGEVDFMEPTATHADQGELHVYAADGSDAGAMEIAEYSEDVEQSDELEEPVAELYDDEEPDWGARRETRSASRSQGGIAKRMLNWSAGTVISNLADNDELDALIDRQLQKRLPQLARDPQVQELIRAQAGMYLAYLLQTPHEVEPLVQLLGNWYIAYLRQNPEGVQGLIREQAGAYLSHLGQDTAQLEPLVQSVAGKYIDHIGEHPEQVQRLIQQEAGTYLVHLTQNPTQVEPLVQTIAGRYLAHLTAHPEPVQKLIQQEADKFIAGLQSEPERVEPLVRVIAGRYLKHMEAHPEEVEKLVQLLADRYLIFLRENPAEVNLLVRQVGDEYIGYLHEHPDQVQDLIQSQSLNMGNEVVEEVRERTVTLDSFVELLGRSLLRRTPREQLPEPPAAVQMRAVNPRQPLPNSTPETAAAKDKEKR
jgi:hypothetical protein